MAEHERGGAPVRVWLTRGPMGGWMGPRVPPDTDAVEYVNASVVRELVEALERIETWSQAYPPDVFPEPDFKRAHALLKAGGLTLDAVAASILRRAVGDVGRIATDALSRIRTEGGRAMSDEQRVNRVVGVAGREEVGE